MTSASFQRLAIVSASTKRLPAIGSDGKRGVAVAVSIAQLHCTPLDPADNQQARDLSFRLRQELDSPIVLLQTFTDADALTVDIVEGDVLVIGTKEYPIRNVGRWAWRGREFLKLLVEEGR